VDQEADDIIIAIFEAVEKDDRGRSLADELRETYERGQWTPEALGQVVERAIEAAMEQSN